MAASITLSTQLYRTDSGTIKLVFSTVGLDISSKVFAIEVMPKSADTLAPSYRFSHVCSPAELIEFPEDEPQDNCYFRVNKVEMIFDTDKIIQSVMDNVKSDINRLVKEFNELNAADPVTTQDVF